MRLKNFQKRITQAILLLIVISLSTFFVENIAYKYGIHYKFPNASYAANPAKRSSKPFLYPAPRQKTSELFRKEGIEYPFTFIVYGDSREIAGDEKDALTTQIIKENPSFILHTGDMVSHGEGHQWKIFDMFDGKIIRRGISFYPALGNHEYHTRKKSYPADPEKQLRHYFDRFKYIKKRRWYSFKYGNSLFLILDSNTDYSPKSHQYKWLMEKLKKETSTFLFITFHHPPYTKSNVYKMRRSKSEKFLAEIFESYKAKTLAKTDIVFSGHAHNYERYKYSGINYIVTGGGGAPPHSIHREPDDFYTGEGETYHYCKIVVSKTKLTFEMIRLDKDTAKWKIADTFTISK